jgi:tRNA(Arg) A34 adenosine deaminase TadA
MIEERPGKRGFKLRTNISAETVETTKKMQRYFELSRNVAYNSPYGKIRHGAILVKGGSILNASFNKDNFSAFGARFRHTSRGHATVHAELGCVLGMPRSSTTGSDIYVCRINSEGEYRFSKPCGMCHDAMKHVGIKRVYYTTNGAAIEMYKL